MSATREASKAKDAQEQLEPSADITLSPLSQQESKSFSDARDNTTVVEQHALFPFDRLYPDILAIIFTHLRDIDPPEKNTYDDHNYRAITPRSGWITVTYVCRRWRQVALEWVTLWSDIDLERLGRRWAAEFAVRAQHAPISIQYKKFLKLGYRDWVVRFLNENMWRTQSLDIGGRPEALATLNSHAPLLHTIQIVTEFDSAVPDSFLGGCTPALRHCRFQARLAPAKSWASPLFSRLTSLHIQHFQPVDDILDLLEHLTELESMSLIFYPSEDRSHRSQPPGRRGVVTPPQLVKLNIYDYPDAAVLPFFLAHLSLGPNCFVHCRIMNPYRNGPVRANYLDELFASVVASAHAHANSAFGKNNAITNLSIDRTYPNFAAARSMTIIPLRHSETAPHLTVEFPRCGPSRCLSDFNIVPKALKTFSSSHLQELTIWTSESHVLDVHAWADLMGRAPGLRRLTVRTAKIVASLCTAMLPVGPDSPAPRLQCIFQALSTLVLTEVRLDADIGAGGRDGDDERVADELPLCLVARAQSGYCLEELDVAQCDVDEAWVTRVREGLPDTRVIWNKGAHSEDGKK
ncbi:hypothetical protein FA95DRAFT_1611198 [Auriscalpium vulgare]|uniref:Uncharacterized protein n=1 Tax=Auriscalpium vulgare TaxID=40419 RepID=A0ACB8RB81_9AGAM|nr:hypothetical protein FA95DRAFT_1611198 [Auriscalpium vulgare]